MILEEFLESKGIDAHTIVCYHFPDEYPDGKCINFEEIMNEWKAMNDSKPLDVYINKLNNLINGLLGDWVSKNILKQILIDLKGLVDNG